MTSEDDAARRKCFRPGTSATRRTSGDRYPGAVPLTHWNISVANLKLIRSATQSRHDYSGVADADIIFLPCVSFFHLFFIPCLISAAADWMSTILRHMVWP